MTGQFDTQGKFKQEKPADCTGVANEYEIAKSIVIDLGHEVVVPRNEREMWIAGRISQYEQVKSCWPSSDSSAPFPF